MKKSGKGVDEAVESQIEDFDDGESLWGTWGSVLLPSCCAQFLFLQNVSDRGDRKTANERINWKNNSYNLEQVGLLYQGSFEMEEDWNIECSDDEYKNVNGPWEPSAERIEMLYSRLEAGEILELNMKCKYRAPSPEVQEAPVANVETKKVEDKSDFDFMDEMTSPKLKIRNKGEETLKGSAKKKTTSLDGVINNMRRHNLIPQTPSS